MTAKVPQKIEEALREYRSTLCTVFFDTTPAKVGERMEAEAEAALLAAIAEELERLTLALSGSEASRLAAEEAVKRTKAEAVEEIARLGSSLEEARDLIGGVRDALDRGEFCLFCSETTRSILSKNGGSK